MIIESTRAYAAAADGTAAALPRTPMPGFASADEVDLCAAYLAATGAAEVAALLPTGLADVVDAIGQAWCDATNAGFAA